MKKTPFLIEVLLKTILSFAVFHLAYLAVAAIVLKDWTLISLWSILDFELLFPGFAQGLAGCISGVMTVAIVFTIVYVVTKRECECCAANDQRSE